MIDKDKIIVRQNVLNRAVDMHNAGKIDLDQILEKARAFETWIWRGIEKTDSVTTPPEIKNKHGAQHLCSDCNKEVSDKVKKFSMDKHKRILCFECQKK